MNNNLDLNIDNYDLQDLMNLFQIDNIDSDENLSKAKNIALKMHPDKSGLDKEYFLFFSKAYKMLYNLYIIQNKTRQKEELLDYKNHKDTINKEEKNILDKLLKNKSKDEFNKWFNKEFENIKLHNEYSETGYGDWLTNNDNIDKDESCNNVETMHRTINKKRETLYKIVNYENIQDYNDEIYCDIGNNAPENYSSGIFDKLMFEDLKKAHTETIIPIDTNDYLNKNNTVEDIKRERDIKINPINEQESINIINRKHNNEKNNDTKRMFNLLKSQQDIENKNKEWWSKYKLIK